MLSTDITIIITIRAVIIPTTTQASGGLGTLSASADTCRPITRHGVPLIAGIAMSNGIAAIMAGIAGAIGKAFIFCLGICHREAVSPA
jgi:hypothetical protein